MHFIEPTYTPIDRCLAFLRKLLFDHRVRFTRLIVFYAWTRRKSTLGESLTNWTIQTYFCDSIYRIRAENRNKCLDIVKNTKFSDWISCLYTQSQPTRIKYLTNPKRQIIKRPLWAWSRSWTRHWPTTPESRWARVPSSSAHCLSPKLTLTSNLTCIRARIFGFHRRHSVGSAVLWNRTHLTGVSSISKSCLYLLTQAHFTRRLNLGAHQLAIRMTKKRFELN